MKTIQELKNNFISETELLIEDVKKLNSCSEAQLNWKTSEDSWSIAECLDHLKVTNQLYFNEFEKQFSEKQLKSDLSITKVKHKLLSKFIIKSVNPANSKKSNTFPVFMPSKSKHDKSVIEKFIDLQTNFLNLISSAKDLNLNKYVMSSPAAKIIKENFCDVLEIIRLHDRRHYNQAKKIFNHPNFPKN